MFAFTPDSESMSLRSFGGPSKLDQGGGACDDAVGGMVLGGVGTTVVGGVGTTVVGVVGTTVVVVGVGVVGAGGAVVVAVAGDGIVVGVTTVTAAGLVVAGARSLAPAVPGTTGAKRFTAAVWSGAWCAPAAGGAVEKSAPLAKTKTITATTTAAEAINHIGRLCVLECVWVERGPAGPPVGISAIHNWLVAASEYLASRSESGRYS